jgi:hypothetical protein
MANWRSTYVCELGWDVTTSQEPGSGTDSPVEITILRDGEPVWNCMLESGETERLDRGSSGYYYIRFHSPIFEPGETDTWTAGLDKNPNGIEFSQGIHGHLVCILSIHGDDLWRESDIGAYVRYCRPAAVPGTIDSMHWQDDDDTTLLGSGDRAFSLSTNSDEGPSSIRLIY